jgi:hypothetical protein
MESMVDAEPRDLGDQVAGRKENKPRGGKERVLWDIILLWISL